jgi:DNA-binding transcriptional regulator LsrR (DeoR family)
MGLEETTAMRSKGAVGDIAGIIINEHGELVDPEFQERCIAIGYEQLRKIPRKIAVAAGSGKAQATIAAARGGLVSGLVVDSDLANAILSQLAETP